MPRPTPSLASVDRPSLDGLVSGDIRLPLAADASAYLDLGRYDAARRARVCEAYLFGRYWHERQVRKGTDRPYFVHPIAVAAILDRRGAPADVVAAGLLHDVVEDTPVRAAEIGERFGPRVGELVAAVTKPQWRPWRLVPDPDAAHLKGADLANNMADTAAAFDEIGPAVWHRFKLGRQKLSTWEHSLVQVEAVGAATDAEGLARTVRELFEWLRATPAR